MNIEKVIPLLLEEPRHFIATGGGIQTRPVKIKRPNGMMSTEAILKTNQKQMIYLHQMSSYLFLKKNTMKQTFLCFQMLVLQESL